MQQNMNLSIMIPVQDDWNEAYDMVTAIRVSVSQELECEFLLVDIGQTQGPHYADLVAMGRVVYLSAKNLPAAKNIAVLNARSELVLFLYPGIFPASGAIDAMVMRLTRNPELVGIAGAWCNANGKLEVGYNVRRLPPLSALVLDILLLNKLFPHNPYTRRYKMHDFDHDKPIYAEHVNDSVFLVRKSVISEYGKFNETYVPGWWDQVEFCLWVKRINGRILYDPNIRFVSNPKIPLINRLVREHYVEYRRTEWLYVRNHHGRNAEILIRICVVIGMSQRLFFSLILPTRIRTWFLGSLRSYVNDEYVQRLRSDYWDALKRSVWGPI